MKKVFPALLIISFLLSGCEGTSTTYPTLTYRNSSSDFDYLNREINIRDGHVLNEGHSFDIVETDQGYDIILHFTEE